MTLKYYNQRLSKERIETYRKAFDHLNLLKPTQTEPSERAGSDFLYKKKPSHKGLASSVTTPVKNSTTEELAQNIDLTADFQAITDEYIDQCIHEWVTWLAQTEKRKRHLTTPLTDRLKPTDFSPLQDKEATT
jgi:hypothetical protein